MAREIVFTDDISGEHGAEPVRFGWADVWFEIDLTEENKAKLEKMLEPYLNAGHPPERTPAVTPSGARRPRTARREPSEKTDYTQPEFAGSPHRGRVSPEEAEYVRSNLDLVNQRLKAEGLREIDATDAKMKDRYGL